MDAQALLYQTFQALAAVARAVPRRAALAAADAVAAVAYGAYRLTPVRGFIRTNLRAAYGPTPADRKLDTVARAHVRELARNIAEVMRLPMLASEATDVIAGVEGWEHVEAARAAGRGVIVATCHYGNWEVLGAALARQGLPVHGLVQRPSQDAFDRLFKETRALCGVQTWENAGAASLRPVLRALARGEALVMLADQHGEAQDAVVRLFGRPVSAPTGPVFFARRTGAAMLPMRAVREADGRHRIHVEPELPTTGDDEADMQALYGVYERWIRERPEHWLWVHDRWAREPELTRPPRHPSLLSSSPTNPPGGEVPRLAQRPRLGAQEWGDAAEPSACGSELAPAARGDGSERAQRSGDEGAREALGVPRTPSPGTEVPTSPPGGFARELERGEGCGVAT